jgi:hypothetical protein
MVVALQPLVAGALWMALLVLAPPALFWIGLQVPKVVDAARERRAVRLAKRQPTGPPLEKLATDLRRLRAEMVYRKPNNYLLLTALMQAYDDVLESMCVRLELPCELGKLPIGPDRNLERLRAEATVQEAGVPLELPWRHDDRRAPPPDQAAS